MTPTLLLKTLLFTVLVPGTVAVAVPLALALPAPMAPFALRIPGFLLLALGFTLYLRCAWEFAARGHGTPAPIDAPRVLVVRGPYRFVRNPMYVGVLAAVLGWAAVFASVAVLTYGLGLALAFHLFIVGFEEHALRRAFGAGYDDYRARVGRWWPRFADSAGSEGAGDSPGGVGFGGAGSGGGAARRARERAIGGLLIDLDGTVYEGDALVPGAAQAIAELRARGVPFLFTTNTSRMSRAAVVERLAGMGLPLRDEEVLTAPMAAALWLRREELTRVLLLLPASTHEDFAEFDSVAAGEGPDAVVVGDMGGDFTFARLNSAFRALRAGARLVAIHRNRFWLPSEGPTLDAGPFVVGLEYAAGVEAVLVGKPAPAFFELAAAQLGVPRERIAVVGDDPESDVRGAAAAGLVVFQVGTGKGREISPSPGADGPSARRIASIAELPGALAASEGG